MTRFLQLSIAFVIWGLCCALPPSTSSAEGARSPLDTVREWMSTYGVNLARAAELTTDRYRSGMTKPQWVEVYGSALEYIQYRHMGGQLVNTHEEGTSARLAFKSTVNSIQGTIVQYEIYHLVKPQDEWLIDFINILGEESDGSSPKTTPRHTAPDAHTPPPSE